MLDVLLFSVALIGAAAGGWIDLKTTEVPDTVPLSMAGAGLIIHIIEAYFSGNLFPLYSAVAVGLGYLLFGYILYYTGQWGEADVLLLGAIGFVLPGAPAFFNATVSLMPWKMYALVFLLNTFIIGGVYSVAYALVIASRTKTVKTRFFEDLRANKKSLGMITLMLIAGMSLIAVYVNLFVAKIPVSAIAFQATFILPAFAVLFLIYRFAIVVDREAFRKKIPSAKLREGDVLAENISVNGLKMPGKLFIGLTKEQIKKIRDSKKSVLIKEGIRYGPTFFLALVATWFFGNLMSFFLF